MTDDRPNWRIAWLMLALVSLANYGNFYVYDSIGPVADLLQRQRDFSDSQIGMLNAIYSLPNIVLLLVGGVILHRTSFGRRVYVIGNNADVARYSGIDVARVKLILFTTSGLVAGVAGVLFAARLGSVRANIGEGFELDIITMVLLGGVSIFGGSGTLLGVALAICIVLNLRNGLGLANVEANTQTGVIGALLIVSVLAQNVLDRLPIRRREAEA